MSLSALLRHTNKIKRNPERGYLVKIYLDYPHTVFGQFALGLRPWSALRAVYRCEIEQRKVDILQRAGFPLAQEYLLFENSPYEPMSVVRYDPSFLNVEEKIRQGMAKEDALTLIGRCATQLRELHQVGNGSRALTHGDPYLENIRYYPDGSVRWFDFEHEHTSVGDEAKAMDGAIFVGHALQVLRSCGHVKSKQDRADLRDAIEQHYPRLRTDAQQGKLYLRLRFG